jgi:hypothetical protein
MAGNKWMTKLLKKDGAVKWDYNPFSNVIRTGSPSFDYIYGKTHGLPLGYSEVLWGPPKGGKSLGVYLKIGNLHQSDPNAMAVLYSTEQRAELQLTPLMMRQYGIDPERFVAIQTGLPDEIFDHINGDLKADIQDGMPLKYIAIDSVTSIAGRRTLNADSIMTQQIGDQAKTIQDGLQMILPVIRRNRIAVTLVAQARAELDQLEQMRGNKLKMAGAWALQHFAEYFIFVEQNRSKDGKADLSGQVFEDTSKTDVMGHAERTAHKIRVTMKGNSSGVAGRVGQFTLDYYEGLKNLHEEAFLLGVGQGVVVRPNNTAYTVPDFPTKGEQATYRGKDNFIMALRDNPILCGEILKRVRAIDFDAMETGRSAPSGIAESSADAAENQLTDQPLVD